MIICSYISFAGKPESIAYSSDKQIKVKIRKYCTEQIVQNTTEPSRMQPAAVDANSVIDAALTGVTSQIYIQISECDIKRFHNGHCG